MKLVKYNGERKSNCFFEKAGKLLPFSYKIALDRHKYVLNLYK